MNQKCVDVLWCYQRELLGLVNWKINKLQSID